MSNSEQLDPDIARFNESANRAGKGSRLRRRRPPERVEPGVGFKLYRVSKAGQLTLPGSARSSWELREGGQVHVAHTGDFVVIVRAGSWSRALQNWTIESDLVRELQEEISSTRAEHLR